MPVDPRDARRQAFLNRMNTGKQTSSGLGLGFFKPNLQGVKFFNCKEGDHDMDIVPYLAGPDDPNTPEGEWTYVLEVYNHRDVGGIEGQDYICMAKTYKQPCPVCEHRQTLIKEGADDEVIKELRPSRYPRSIYNILCYDDNTEQAKGVQVFHTSHYLMEMYLLKLAESSKRDIDAGAPPYKFFADPDEGYSIKFTRTGQGLNTRYIAHQLVQRQGYIIGPDVLEQAHQLDQLIHLPPYEEVYKAFWGEELGDAGAGAPYVEQQAAPNPRAMAATPARSPQPAASQPQYEEQYDDQAGDYVCPGGGTFGVDTYNLQHCEACELWEPCVQANQAYAGEEAQGYEETGVAEEQEAPSPQPAPAPAGRGGGTRGPAQAPGPRGGGAPPARGGAPAGRTAQPAPAGRGGGAPGPRGGGAPPARGGAPAGRGGAPAPGGRGGNARPAPGAKRTLHH